MVASITSIVHIVPFEIIQSFIVANDTIPIISCKQYDQQITQLLLILDQKIPLYFLTAIVINKQKKSSFSSVKVMQRKKNALHLPFHDYCLKYALQ